MPAEGIITWRYRPAVGERLPEGLHGGGRVLTDFGQTGQIQNALRKYFAAKNSVRECISHQHNFRHKSSFKPHQVVSFSID